MTQWQGVVYSGRADATAPPRRGGWAAAERLDASRAQLVRDYLPLVRADLKRRAGVRRAGRRCVDDLFQEGCLGLIRAALRYDPAAGISFAAFARPRIQCAVNRAMNTRDDVHSLSASELLRRAQAWSADDDRRCADDVDPAEGPAVPGMEQVIRRAAVLLHDRLDLQQAAGKDEDEIADADQAAGTGTGAGSSRSSLLESEHRLVDAVVAQLLQSDAAEDASLRRLTRQTGATYARVRRCVRNLRDAARRLIAADPGFAPHPRARSPGAGIVSDPGAAERERARHDPVVCAEESHKRRARQRRHRRQRQQRYRQRRRAHRIAAEGGIPPKIAGNSVFLADSGARHSSS